ncbi:hypothetical protein ACVWZ4_000007 [Bradyrhizobium sp. USDA 4472]
MRLDGSEVSPAVDLAHGWHTNSNFINDINDWMTLTQGHAS